MSRTDLNRYIDKLFGYFGLLSTFIGLLLLAVFISKIAFAGIQRINWEFLTSIPSRIPENSGIYTAMMGTLWIMAMSLIFALPLGISAGIYLEEYAGKSRLANILEINISNLAGIPSIIYGILGLEVFARFLGLGGSLLTGSLTLSLLILPIIIVTTRESMKAVPKSIKEGAYAMGATKWQTIWTQSLPAASGNIITGIILAMARAIGEAAPLLVAGALVFVPFAPTTPMDDYSIMPIQIFNWVSRPQKAFEINAAAGIILLLLITFFLNGIAIYFRNKMQKKMKW